MCRGLILANVEFFLIGMEFLRKNWSLGLINGQNQAIPPWTHKISAANLSQAWLVFGWETTWKYQVP